MSLMRMMRSLFESVTKICPAALTKMPYGKENWLIRLPPGLNVVAQPHILRARFDIDQDRPHAGARSAEYIGSDSVAHHDDILRRNMPPLRDVRQNGGMRLASAKPG